MLQEKMFQLIENWKASGLSKNEFLKNSDYTIHKLNYWLDKYAVSKEIKQNKSLNNGDFRQLVIPCFSSDASLDLDVSSRQESKKLVELHTPSGLKITIFE